MSAWLWLIPGLLWPLLLPALPAPGVLFLVCSAVFALSFAFRHPAILFLLLGSAWTLTHLQAGLQLRMHPLEGQTAIVKGHVIDLPVVRGEMLSFRFNAELPTGPRLSSRTILVRWYRDWPEIRAGDHWQLNLELKPARGRVNFSGTDREQWYFAQGISALATVKPGPNQRLARGPGFLPAWRQSIATSLNEILEGHPARPVILALALAYRGDISPSQWAGFRSTGTSHLLAISGLHIGLAAMFGFWAGRFFSLLLPSRWLLGYGFRICWFASISVAGCYALLSGFQTSTQRAMLMLLAVCLIQLCRRQVSAARTLLFALVLVLVADPLAPLGAGFWFSFLAVAVLTFVLAPAHGSGHRLFTLARVQLALMVVMTPLAMLWFQQVTFIGLFSNLLAIPWVSLTVVPAILLSVGLLPLATAPAAFLLFIAAESLNMLSVMLEWLAGLGQAGWFMTHRPGLLSVVLATVGGFLLILPRAMIHRLAGLLLMTPMLFPQGHSGDSLRVEVLDVGQGLAVLVETGGHLLLYDTGPGDGVSWSLVPAVVAPAIAQTGRRVPDRIIVSHGDLDHAGGLRDLQQLYPESRFSANLRSPATEFEACRSSQAWHWGRAIFRVLHPAAGLPYLGNNSSCVISVVHPEHSVLLTGDIGTAVEQRLIQQDLERHTVLFAPHHGSNSSSTTEFIATVQPEISLVSAGYLNRFGFPSTEVIQRHDRQGVRLFSTSDCGALEIRLGPGNKPSIFSARRERNALWRWQAEPHCP